MAANKWYNSKTWLTRKYLVERLSPEQIAALCGCSHMTIYRKLKDFELIR